MIEKLKSVMEAINWRVTIPIVSGVIIIGLIVLLIILRKRKKERIALKKAERIRKLDDAISNNRKTDN